MQFFVTLYGTFLWAYPKLNWLDCVSPAFDYAVRLRDYRRPSTQRATRALLYPQTRSSVYKSIGWHCANTSAIYSSIPFKQAIELRYSLKSHHTIGRRACDVIKNAVAAWLQHNTNAPPQSSRAGDHATSIICIRAGMCVSYALISRQY